MKISVIIPMYNESVIAESTARELSSYMSEHFDEYEVIFFDDGSSDGCCDIVNGLGLPFVRALRYEQNRGKGCAVRHGMLAADGDIRIFTDADLAYGMDVISRAVDIMKTDESADIVIGSRNIGKDGYEGYTMHRRLMSKIYIKVLCAVGGFKLSDSQCGIKAFRGAAADAVFSKCTVDSFAFDFEVILRANKQGYNISEMPVKIINHRQSSVRPVRDSLKMLRDLRRIKKEIKKNG